MILAVLSSSILGITLPEDPAPIAPDHRVEPALVMVVEQTRLELRSQTLDPLLLLVAVEAGEPRLATWLPPGTFMETRFARGAMSGMQFEVVQRVAGRWRSSGTFELTDAEAGEPELTFVFPSGIALSAQVAGPITPLIAGPSLLPAGGYPWATTPNNGSLPSLPNAAPPLHVPLPEPNDAPDRGAPPKLEKKPLPPV